VRRCTLAEVGDIAIPSAVSARLNWCAAARSPKSETETIPTWMTMSSLIVPGVNPWGVCVEMFMLSASVRNPSAAPRAAMFMPRYPVPFHPTCGNCASAGVDALRRSRISGSYMSGMPAETVAAVTASLVSSGLKCLWILSTTNPLYTSRLALFESMLWMLCVSPLGPTGTNPRLFQKWSYASLAFVRPSCLPIDDP